MQSVSPHCNSNCALLNVGVREFLCLSRNREGLDVNGRYLLDDPPDFQRSGLKFPDRKFRKHQDHLATLECLKQPDRRLAELVVFAATQNRCVRVDPRLHWIIP